MALTSTSLSGDITNTTLTLGVTSATGFVVGNPVLVEQEVVGGIVSVIGTAVNVRTRGDAGTAAVAHSQGALVVTGPGTEMPPPASLAPVPPITTTATLNADATVTVDPAAQGWLTYVITKATAAAITLNSPTASQNRLRVTFRSATAAAHAVTYTPGFYADTTGSDIATFAAKNGASFTIEANNGTWGVVALGNVTIA
jgi:hypothetical protein